MQDQPGTVARITGILSDNSISITSLLQQEGQKDSIPLVMTTHQAKAGDMAKALEEISRLGEVEDSPVSLKIVEEHPESVV